MKRCLQLLMLFKSGNQQPRLVNIKFQMLPWTIKLQQKKNNNNKTKQNIPNQQKSKTVL